MEYLEIAIRVVVMILFVLVGIHFLSKTKNQTSFHWSNFGFGPGNWPMVHYFAPKYWMEPYKVKKETLYGTKDWIIGGLALVIICLFLYKGKGQVNQPIQQRAIAAPANDYYVVSWEKPDGVNGLNPDQRNLSSLEVTIERNDGQILALSGPRGAKLYWDKKKSEFGEWSDAEGASGHFYLEPKGGGNQDGWMSDALGTRIPFHLRKRRA